MSLTAIPLQFEKYLQNQISVGNGPGMNEMIFAYIPGLDLTQPIDRSQGLPDVSLWVHQQDIDQVGKLGDNALVYSVVIPGSVAAFTFNAIYLRDKNVPNSCGMVVHKADETKENGMASTKSLMQQYTGAAQIAGVDVDATTWQIDYQARLLGIEDDMRLANLDNYGHTAFVDGFDVVQQADPTKYAISPGVAYVGGLRAVLDDEVIQTINTKPNGLYLDVVRMGTALSQWQNVVTVRLSPVELSDYVDGSNQQHFVAKLAGINADGTVADWRVKGGLGEHEAASNPHPQYVKTSRQSVVNLFRENQNFNVPGQDGTLTEVEQTFTVDQEFSKGWFVKSGTFIARLFNGRIQRSGLSSGTITRKYPKNVSGLPKANDLIGSIEGSDGVRRYSSDVQEISVREDDNFVYLDVDVQAVTYDMGSPCLSYQKAAPLPLSDVDSANSNVVPLITTDTGWGDAVPLDWSASGFKTSELKGLLIVTKVLTGTEIFKGMYSQLHPSRLAIGEKLMGVCMNDSEPTSTYKVVAGIKDVTDTTAVTFLNSEGYTGAVFGVYGVL
ncbi:phage tail-collar fiber domain-containing protein [Vibrio fluvialis]|uniref:phage tail-collar fiber domain-containing protein n=1 Tax=Vibrio fluvialis TaxID=676 RepID=UPI001F3E9FB9|nr:phage tail protein [Vibrio fluvialis]MCE7582116.1 phage tail protein [Vibrio fluvialis]